MRSFLVSLSLALLAFAFAPSALAASGINGTTLFVSEAAAFAGCQADLAANPNYSDNACGISSTGVPVGYSSLCPGTGPAANGSNYTGHTTGGIGISYNWCVPQNCTAGVAPNGTTDYTAADPGAYLSGGGVADMGGCCVTFSFTQGQFQVGDEAHATITGHPVQTGARCITNMSGNDAGGVIPNPPRLQPYSHCPKGQASCYNPFDDNFCSQSESGEWFCVPRKTPDPGGCISGATGSECLGKDGNPVPNPPDPPIKNGTPPDSTNNYTINDGGTTNNYITNNYSGTSAGPQSSSPPTSSPGGTGSNTSGNGNTGKNGTDSNGNCPNGSKPTASGCSGTYTDNGCDTPPACFGDAVLCGIAANTHKSACAASGGSVGAPPSGLDGDPTDNSGDPTSSAVSSSVDLGDATGSLDGSGFGYSSSCPLQDVSFSVFGQSVDIPFADKCDKLAFLKYIVLALAYFMAAKVIAGVQ